LKRPSKNYFCSLLALLALCLFANLCVATPPQRLLAPDGTTRLALGPLTLEAVSDTKIVWPVTLPPHARFEAHVGVTEDGWTATAKKEVLFRLSMLRNGEQRVLAEKRARPPAEWHRLDADLQAYGGATVQLLLEILSGDEALAAQAYWGNPLFFSQAVETEQPSVILISLDTTRADHLSVYGYARDTTPRLKEWAREAVVFENAFTEETWTLPAHATMFTGLHPNRHGVTMGVHLAESFTTLAETTRAQGYLTAAFTGSSLWFYDWRKLCQGFDYYQIPRELRSVEETKELVETWLGQHPRNPAFLFFHLMDMHSRPMSMGFDVPYGPRDPDARHFANSLGPAPKLWYKKKGKRFQAGHFLMAYNKGGLDVDPATHRYITALYDDSIRRSDAALGDFFAGLRKAGRYMNALIIVTADHGEDLNDHGRYDHWATYEECARIPMLIKFPQGRFAGRRYTGLVQLADLYPTICEVTGANAPEGLDGISLLRFLEGDAPPREFVPIQRNKQQAIRTASWKYIHDTDGKQDEAYDLSNDPTEKHNRLQEAPTALTDAHAAFFQRPAAGWHIAFQAPNTKPDAQLIITTQDAFIESSLRNDTGPLQKGLRSSPQKVIVDLKHCPQGQLHLRAATPSSITLQAPNFQWILDDKTVSLGMGSQFILAPHATPSTPSPLPKNHSAQATVWYIPHTPPPTKEPLNDEQRELMEGLGYLGDE
jgi:arylsulfatase A-like enzyme